MTQKKKFSIGAVLGVLGLLAIAAWWYLSSAEKPAAPVATVNPSALIRAHSPSEGKADAPVVIVEFFDPACDTCRQFYPMVKQMMAENPGRIRLVMRFAPFHQGSDKVVAVLEGARRQGKFWPALEALLASQDDWASNHVAKVDLVWKHLEGTGVNMEQLALDMTAPDLQQVIAQDLQDANTLNVTQTPEYFVNGRPLPSFGAEQLKQLVAEELASKR